MRRIVQANQKSVPLPERNCGTTVGMKRIHYVTATFCTAAVAASCAAAPAVAEPCVVDALGRVATAFPPGCTPPPAAPTTTAPSTSSSGGGLSGFVSEHAGLVVLVVVGLIAWAVIAGLRSQGDEERKLAAQQQAAELNRGRVIAQDHHAEQVHAARESAAWQAPDPATYDPMGLGVQPPAAAEPDLPAPPPQSPADLKRYSTFGAVVPWIPSTAFAQVVARDGSIEAADRAWIEACRAARFGDFDVETGAFTPAAELTNVRNVVGSGDVIIAVQPRDIFVTEQQLNAVRKFLVQTARVRSASEFEREFETGKYTTRLSNADPAAQAAAAPQQQTPADPASGWEW